MKKFLILYTVCISIILIIGALIFFQSRNNIELNSISVSDRSNSSVDGNFQIFVSPEGDDSDSGLIDSPVLSFNRAITLAKNYVREGQESDIEIILREGIYRLDSPVIIDDTFQNSDHSLSIKPYPNENVTFLGSRNIQSEWVNIGNNVWEVSLEDIWPLFGKAEKRPRSVYIDDVKLQNSRYPYEDDEFLRAEEVSADWSSIKVGNLNLPIEAFNNGDSELVSLIQWTTSRVAIESVDQNGNINTTKPAHFVDATFNPPNAGMRLFLENIDLDSVPDRFDKVWAFDLATRSLRMKSSENPTQLEIEIPILDNFILIKGTSGSPVRNVSISGINFEYMAGYNFSDDTHYGIQAGLTFTGRNKSAVEILFGENIDITKNTFKHILGNAIAVSDQSRFVNVDNNDISDVGATCIFVGQQAQKFQDNGTNNVSISNNYIENCGNYTLDGIGIFQAWSKEIEILNNVVTNLPYTGISIGFVYGPEEHFQGNINITENKIYNISNMLCDAGAIYAVGANPNVIISKNLIYDVNGPNYDNPCPQYNAPNHGIFFDNSSRGVIVEDNIINDIDGTNINTAPGMSIGFTAADPNDVDIRSNWIETEDYDEDIFNNAGTERINTGAVSFENYELAENVNPGFNSTHSDDENNEDRDSSLIYGCGRLDANGDNEISIADFATFARKYNAICDIENAEKDEDINSCGYIDNDENGIVDIKDFSIFARKYLEKTCN